VYRVMFSNVAEINVWLKQEQGFKGLPSVEHVWRLLCLIMSTVKDVFYAEENGRGMMVG
jgi:hypothetical protein